MRRGMIFPSSFAEGIHLKRVLFSSLLALAMGASAFAQDVYGNIAGAVLDPSGAAVPHAKVTVIHTDRNQEVRSLQTDANGNWSAPLLPIGAYALKAEASGFKTLTRG